MLKQYIKNGPPKLPAIGPAKLMCLAGWEATVFVEVGVVDADVCVAVEEDRSVIIDEAVLVDVEMVELGDVRSNPASATEALHTIPPHVKNLTGPGCHAPAIDILCK
jgi:hypothetical protein